MIRILMCMVLFALVAPTVGCKLPNPAEEKRERGSDKDDDREDDDREGDAEPGAEVRALPVTRTVALGCDRFKPLDVPTDGVSLNVDAVRLGVSGRGPVWAAPTADGLLWADALGNVGTLSEKASATLDNPWPVPEEPWRDGVVADGVGFLVGGAGRIARVNLADGEVVQVASPTDAPWQVIAPHPSGLMYAGSSGRLRIADAEGRGTQRLYLGLPDPDREKQGSRTPLNGIAVDIHDLALAPGVADHVWMATSDGVFVSRDGGASACLSTESPTAARSVSPLNVAEAFVVDDSGQLWFTGDGGLHYVAWPSALEFTGPVLPLDNQRVVAATSVGVVVVDTQSDAEPLILSRVTGLNNLERTDSRAIFSGAGGFWLDISLAPAR